jgi:hypothetical protein
VRGENAGISLLDLRRGIEDDESVGPESKPAIPESLDAGTLRVALDDLTEGKPSGCAPSRSTAT